MIEKSHLAEQSLIDCLKTHYGIDVETLTFLPLGADIDALAYKAQTNNLDSYFVKLKRGRHPNISTSIIEFLQNAGIQHIIPLVRTTRGKFSQPLDDSTVIVSPFVEGVDGFSRNLTDEQWYGLGRVMRQIHDLEIPQSIQSKLRRETYSPKWRQAVRSLYPLLDSEPSGDEIAKKLLLFMKKHKVEIHRLVDRVEQLSQLVQEQTPKFVLCHSDIHGGNVLMEGTDTFFIVDWDDPIIAPKERDLLFIGGGVANVWNKPHEVELFYEGYGEVEVNNILLAYYRHERIVEDIALYSHQLLLSKEGGQTRRQWYTEFVDQFEPEGVVEIAFKTDESL